MKCRIEKNAVQETLILPLYSRKLCTELYPNLYRDETAVRLLDQIDYDFSEAEKNSRSLMQRFGALEVAMRQGDLAFEVRDYLKGHPNAAVVNLGCGLDNTGRTCDNGRCKIYNLDFPDVIALRQQLLPAGDREQNIPCDLKDTTWFSKIDASGGAVFFASGVFYYFLLRTSTLGYVIAPPTDLPGVRTVCTVLPVPLSGVKSLFTLLGRLGVNSCIGLCYFHGLSSVNGGALKILGDGQLKSGHSFGSFSQNP